MINVFQFNALKYLTQSIHFFPDISLGGITVDYCIWTQYLVWQVAKKSLKENLNLKENINVLY